MLLKPVLFNVSAGVALQMLHDTGLSESVIFSVIHCSFC